MRTSIPFPLVAAFVEELGADLDATASIEITHDRVTVTEYRLNEHGARFAAGGAPAKVVTDIRIERET
ncbi:hypothetical protein ACFXAZ_36670 [Streptomyces sp. NPDC059477]|uniref:hypothetical protein n=1 Tax=Streptomyces sp. NPDC059477 TaxID=3346847 RepID=UPI0036A44445